MVPILNILRGSYKDNAVLLNRSNCSLKYEWITHNFLYKIGYKRERTKDCDLDFPCDKCEWIYIAIGFLVQMFVK